MTSLPDLIQQGSTNLWLFIPTAMFLGALHGLEPGHSKTMMAAFIVAVRGTVGQAILLGLSAALSHTAIVWLVALGGQYLGRNLNTASTEPYLQMASAVIVFGVAAWMIWQTRREDVGHDHDHDDHDHAHDHSHGNGDEQHRINTGHGVIALEVFEDGVPPRWRIRTESGQAWPAGDVSVTTERPDRSRQMFAFADKGAYLESVDEIPEPHEFVVHVALGHGGHTHSYKLAFSEHDHDHGHGASPSEGDGLRVSRDGEAMDAHQRAHAADIKRRFAGRSVTTGQIVLFGLTGGLIPCPAAITVLLLCLQLKQISLGVVLVIFFSIGLAVTMVSAGVIASLSVKHIRKRWSGFDALSRRAPYASAGLMVVIGLYMGISGWIGMHGGHAPQV